MTQPGNKESQTSVEHPIKRTALKAVIALPLGLTASMLADTIVPRRTSSGIVLAHDSRDIEEARMLRGLTVAEFNLESIDTGYDELKRYTGATVAGAETPEELKAKYPNHPELWEINRLQLLRFSLVNLPDHLYAPNSKAGKLTVTLTVSTVSTCCHGSGGRHELRLSDQMFDPRYPEYGYRVKAHELVHGVTTPPHYWDTSFHLNEEKKPEFEKRMKDLDERVAAITREGLTPARARVIAQMGNDYDELNKIFDLIEERDCSIPALNLDPEITDKMIFYSGLLWGLKYETEFVSVASENYVMGKEWFYRYYGLFFNNVVIDDLFYYVKNDIFGDKEDRKTPDFSLLKPKVTPVENVIEQSF